MTRLMRIWDWGIKRFIPYAIPGVIITALAKVGAILQNNIFIFAMIGGICVIIALVAFDKLKEPYYPHLVAAIGFALLLQTTMYGSGLVGSDIHTEYYFYSQALNGWDFTNPHPYNSAIGSTIIAPFLTNVFHIPGYWIFKFIFPLLFAFVPFLLYFVFKKEFGAKTAFFSALFFVIVPTWSMELTGIPRQMLGELMLALCLFLVIVSKWSLKIRIPLLIILGILGAMFHYVMGPIIFGYLGVGGIVLLFYKRRVFPVKWIGLVAGIILLCGGTYYGTVCQGMPLLCMTTGSKIVQALVINMLPESVGIDNPELDIPDYPFEKPDYPFVDERQIDESDDVTVDSGIPGQEPIVVVENQGGISFFDRLGPLIRLAWGADFSESSLWGKVFRGFQYLTQLAIVVGFALLIKNGKKYSAEYLSFCIVAGGLLIVCLVIPQFATLINATRFYHLTLFLLAPLFVIGGKFIFRNFKVLTVCLVIPYFLFASGFVFEVTQQPDIVQVGMPYSVSLSNHRVDIAGVFTTNDVAVRDWALDNGLGEEIYTDTHTQLLLWEKHYTFWRDIKEALATGNFEYGKYIFLSERNNRDRTLTLRPPSGGSSTGRRVSYSYEELGIDTLFEAGRIVYQQGDACLLEVA